MGGSKGLCRAVGVVLAGSGPKIDDYQAGARCFSLLSFSMVVPGLVVNVRGSATNDIIGNCYTDTRDHFCATCETCNACLPMSSSVLADVHAGCSLRCQEANQKVCHSEKCVTLQKVCHSAGA